jgi:class 3 adenylate cyclase
MRSLTKKLELTLGPDTSDLSLCIGMHSGPVTGGVLRGERSRFQLFGDTMNTASRMESTSIKGRIQLSQDTTDLLQAAN